MAPLAIIFMALCLTACQSSEDRFWGDVSQVVKQTQPTRL